MTKEGLGRKKELRIFLQSLLTYEGLWVHITEFTDEISAIDMSYEVNLNLDDAIQ